MFKGGDIGFRDSEIDLFCLLDSEIFYFSFRDSEILLPSETENIKSQYLGSPKMIISVSEGKSISESRKEK
jgi:hypothetical protein